MTIPPKTASEIAIMKESGRILNSVLEKVHDMVKPGMSLREIDTYAHDLIRQANATPSFLNYHGFPASTCLSINDVVVHGIPDDYILKHGDLLGVDIGVKYEGYNTDAAFTMGVGAISTENQTLLAVTQEALRVGVEAAIAGNRVEDIGGAIEPYVKSQGNYGIIRDLAGHGVGKNLQEPPEVVNYRAKNPTPLINGMTLAIEPMISLGTYHVDIAPDNWSVITLDHRNAAQFETTVVIQNNDPIILVPFPLSVPVDGQGKSMV